MKGFLQLSLIGLLLFCIACKKETIVIPDNNAPYLDNVPTVKVENYVNRTFIDLLGREPLDTEMDTEVEALRTGELSDEARLALIVKLQTDTSFIEGDTSYSYAYHQRMYDLAKIRCLEGVADDEIRGQISIYEFGILQDSLLGNWDQIPKKQASVDRLNNVLNSKTELREGTIKINELYARMINNYFFDLINMNTFNFVNAAFDNLLWRYPTQAELLASFDMVEYNIPNTLFGEVGQNKEDFIRIIRDSREIHEGLIIWSYQQLLQRNPETWETVDLFNDFYQTKDLQTIQQAIMVTNEYANF